MHFQENDQRNYNYQIKPSKNVKKIIQEMHYNKIEN